uniref:Uncharacterized protein n=1 Tax=Knipowitschia caucasica TaxID=637954 RepID=A0AAV2LHS1_KNICA
MQHLRAVSACSSHTQEVVTDDRKCLARGGDPIHAASVAICTQEANAKEEGRKEGREREIGTRGTRGERGTWGDVWGGGGVKGGSVPDGVDRDDALL